MHVAGTFAKLAAGGCWGVHAGACTRAPAISCSTTATKATPPATSCMHLHIHEYTYTHIHMRICMHHCCNIPCNTFDVYVCLYVIVCADIYTYIACRIYIHAPPPAALRDYIFIYTCMHIHLHAYMRAYTHTHAHTCIHIYMHTYIHTNANTHTRIHTYTPTRIDTHRYRYAYTHQHVPTNQCMRVRCTCVYAFRCRTCVRVCVRM